MKLKMLSIIAASLSVLAGSYAQASNEVNVYSARKEKLIKPLLDKFTAATGIKTNLVTAKADKLLTRLQNEGRNSPADLFITVDAGRLHRAREKGVLQAINSSTINSIVPSHLRDPDDQWVALSQRSRVIFYVKDRVKADELSSYEDLANPKWKKRICIRGSSNIYNQSLLASMIETNGEQAAEAWARGIVANMARPPKGGDRDQIKAAAAGQCDIAIANTYYYGTMLSNKKDPAQMAAANKVAIFWPNQSGRGAHVNVSGAGITRHAPNKENAIRLLAFLVSPESQKWYAEVNFEYPVTADAETSDMLKSWGAFKADNLNLSRLGANNVTAVKIMDRAGWR
ncbi:MAG: Fe(3+) ABC transporter substrate-binding protein [Gammaproteobacteria bacterium]|nr:Fe(3+) ABC transporter substrate-binding protein [Gammaproteobacteria bacterium]